MDLVPMIHKLSAIPYSLHIPPLFFALLVTVLVCDCNCHAHLADVTGAARSV